MIGYLYSEMTRLLLRFLGKFVTTTAIRATSDITKVELKSADNQLPEHLLAVSMKPRSYLADNKDSHLRISALSSSKYEEKGHIAFF